MNGGTVSSHSLKTQMVTSYAQSGPGQRSLGKDKPQYCNAYAEFFRPKSVARLAAAVLSLNRGKI